MGDSVGAEARQDPIRHLRLEYDANTAEGSTYMTPRSVSGTWLCDGVVLRIETDECATTTHVTLVIDDKTATQLVAAIGRARRARRKATEERSPDE